MIEEETGGRLNFEALREAIERRDPDRLLAFYADDAELRVVNAGVVDGLAFELHGSAHIERYLRVVFANDAPRRLEVEVRGEERIVFAEECAYPDGITVLVRTTLELAEGRISRQLDVVEPRHDDPVRRWPLDVLGGERGKQRPP